MTQAAIADVLDAAADTGTVFGTEDRARRMWETASMMMPYIDHDFTEYQPSVAFDRKAIATSHAIDETGIGLLRATQSSNLAGLVIDADSDDLRIIGRNDIATSLIPSNASSLWHAARINHMTFEELRSHVLMVAASGSPYHGEITLAGDPPPSRRKVSVLKLQPDNEADTSIMLIIGAHNPWRDCEAWDASVDRHPDNMARPPLHDRP